ncbi:hypothetical protein ABWU93_11400 [Xanthomonas translucens pv. translucens]|uniref:hypothetical protein n=1 Tax=Xanthomonas campestris pv. translucens TaxID=343 RepID=UPI003F723CA2
MDRSVMGAQRGGHVHVPDDGRGPRRVFVDGAEVREVVFADTRRGVVRYYPLPLKAHKQGKRLIERTRRGLVRVEPIPVVDSGQARG